MVMALAAFERRAEPDGPGYVDAVDDLIHAVFFLVGPRFDVHGRAAMETGGDLLVERRARQQVARNLLDRELIERHVGVEGADHPIAIRPDRAVAVTLIAVAVGIAGGVEPGRRPSHDLAVSRLGSAPSTPTCRSINSRSSKLRA